MSRSARSSPTKDELEAAQLGIAIDQFRSSSKPPRLLMRERRDLVDGMQRVIEGMYAHLPLKRARYGIDPVQRLRRLRTRVRQFADDEAFNFEISSILAGLRDWHTNFERPHDKGLVAALPFMVEMHGKPEAPHYIVSKVGSHVTSSTFKSGVAIKTWNFVPIDRVVLRHGELESGGRPDSQRAMALTSLTTRPLCYFGLPDEQEVHIEYRSLDKLGRPNGPLDQHRFSWRVLETTLVDRFRGSSKRKRRLPGSRVMAINPVASEIKRAKLLLYGADALRGKKEKPPYDGRPPAGPGIQTEVIDTKLRGILRAAKVRGAGGPYGYLRIFTFDVPSTKVFLKELARVLALMPPRGLIIDIRDNPGGVIVAAEMALQFFVPRPIAPVRFSILATDFSRRFCKLPAQRAEYDPWIESIDAAVENGEPYSSALPITDPGKAKFVSQIYHGPVVLVADATTYSSGDLFAAGFVDNAIGQLVCVGKSTGAGGACVWNYKELKAAVSTANFDLPSLPGGAGFAFSMMRATRVETNLGRQIEDVGVPGQIHYEMTRADLLHSNRDLLATCIDLLR